MASWYIISQQKLIGGVFPVELGTWSQGVHILMSIRMKDWLWVNIAYIVCTFVLKISRSSTWSDSMITIGMRKRDAMIKNFLSWRVSCGGRCFTIWER